MSALAKQSEPARGALTQPVILVVEDDVAMRTLIAEVLAPLDAQIVVSRNAQDALESIESRDIAVVVTDLRMPLADGIKVLNFAKQRNPLTQVVVLTGFATVETAVEALKSGAYDYLRKPFEPADLLRTIERCLQFFLLNRENLLLREPGNSAGDCDDLVGKSPVVDAVRKLIEVSAGYDCSVLITGESGTGKEVVAKRIHAKSRRRDNAFIAINCAAIPENLIESELFGFQRGAFTGADRTKLGLFEVANGGTLFLDEINSASPSLQAKLLRVLQDGKFFRMGATEPSHVDVRLLVATNRPLADLVANGAFRNDLYYRLKIVEINTPPLREHKSDIPLLANYFVAKQSAQLKKPVKGLTTKALGALARHDWPGNGRELENVILRMIIFTNSEVLDIDVVPTDLQDTKEGRGKAVDYISPQSLDEVEAYFIAKTLRETKGNRVATAEILGIDKSTLWRKIKRHHLE
jgi:DNA-binding NtrC family response regulator